MRALGAKWITQIKKQLVTLDKLIGEFIAQSQELGSKAAKPEASSGVGARTAALLLSQMPELGELNRGQAVALRPVAPYAHESGQLRGRRSIYAAGAPCAAASTGQRWSRRDSTRSCALSTNACAPPADRPNSLLSPPCVNF